MTGGASVASPSVAWLLSGVLSASVLGSLHCVAMCGPLASLAVGNAPSKGRLALGHSLGRLAVYVAMGVVFGLLGRSLDLAGQWLQVQRVAMVLAGAAILTWGLYTLAVALGMKPVRTQNRAYGNMLVKLRRSPPGRRAVWMGLLSGLLPCGWLWSFAILAAGTAHPLTGAAVMATFWLGTVPSMTGAMTLLEPVLRLVRQRLPIVTGVVIVLLGASALWMRAPLLRDEVAAKSATAEDAHGAHGSAATADLPLAPPACHGGP